MKVLVIGSGGREHALLWKLAHSPSVKEVYVIPGNDGMTDVAHLIPVKGTEDILDFARLMEVDLTVAGPETVLTEGLADKFAEKGMAFFGPSAAAAQIEGSKSFAKNLMKKYKIPTAAYETFTDEEKAVSYIKKRKKYPLVIKADGLASGKGVVIAETEEQAVQAVRGMLEGKTFGSAGEFVVIEEFMEGEEASVLCFTDGNTIVPMISAQDHKRISDGDMGANTGGMGAYAPAPVLTDRWRQVVEEKILRPVVDGLAKEGIPYKGCLYAGLMLTDKGPKVVEFNCRFGDPETQVVLPLLDGDLGEIMMACANGRLTEDMVSWRDGSAACVILASAGYPETSHKDDVIDGDLSFTEDTLVFHSGTSFKDGHYVTAGGRVLGIVGLGDDLQKALDKAYERVAKVRFEGRQYRKDIGQKAFAHLR